MPPPGAVKPSVSIARSDIERIHDVQHSDVQTLLVLL